MLFYHFGYAQHGPARRGKRLRPQIVLRTALGLGADAADALDAAAAVEILHNYSLVHDDIEDRDELRHGRATLWNLYGVAQAINAGDAMCAISFLTLLRAGARISPVRTVSMIEALHEAHRVMCDGQSLDLQFETAESVSLAAYYHMIECKTAALFEASCFLGAHCARATPEVVKACGKLGRAYGIAFQIRDDMLGIWASSDATGKTAANDIARRKWTYPVVWALEQPPSRARSAVEDAYARGGELDGTQVEAVVSALDDLGAREAARRAVAEPMAVVESHPDSALSEYLLGTLAQTHV
ncbi:MAG: polyprenyl synthetase family protein [Candidatus Eremiobacteraeota bacterium]|nr:polyprenyl synthetase family protein [Candidatus Eremiobacteraeota bacterium]